MGFVSSTCPRQAIHKVIRPFLSANICGINWSGVLLRSDAKTTPGHGNDDDYDDDYLDNLSNNSPVPLKS